MLPRWLPVLFVLAGIGCRQVERKVARRVEAKRSAEAPASVAPDAAAPAPAVAAAAPAGDPIARAEIAILEKNPARALELLLPLVKANPGSVDIQLLLGRAYEALGKKDDALAALAAVLERDPKNAAAAALACRIRAERREVGPAEAACRKALAIAPGDHRTRFYHGITLMRLRRTGEAIRELEAVARAWKDHTEVRRHLGRSYANEKRWADARRVLEEARALKDASPELKDLLARSLLETGQPREAAALWREVAAAEPDNADARRWRVEALRRAGLFAEAADEIRAELRRSPDSVQLRHELASVQMLGGDDRGAKETLAALVERARDDAVALYNLGVLHHKTGQFAEASEVLRRAIDADPERVDARLLYANALEMQRRIGEAIAAYREVARRAGSGTAGTRAEAAIERLRGGEAR
jgi:predicted Zn-dependent protease